MNSVHPYRELNSLGSPVRFGKLEDTLPGLLQGYDRIAILTDRNTLYHCLPILFQARIHAEMHSLSIEAGESQKTLAAAEVLWKEIRESHLTRNSLLITLGGGVVTDLGGFVASTYQRGIDFLHIPTSLLAMTDAAIGGKTGINLQAIKNYIGTYSVPQGVCIDSRFFDTLPDREWKNGMIEVYKHGLIADRPLFDQLSAREIADRNNFEEFLYPSIAVKAGIVNRDPGENGERKKLNFGHTIGHALESAFLQKGDDLAHGQAVCVGMIIESWLSHRITGLSREALDRIIGVLIRAFPPCHLATAGEEKIIEFISYDKKRRGNSVGFTLLEEIGKSRTDIPVEKAMIREGLQFYLDLTGHN